MAGKKNTMPTGNFPMDLTNGKTKGRLTAPKISNKKKNQFPKIEGNGIVSLGDSKGRFSTGG